MKTFVKVLLVIQILFHLTISAELRLLGSAKADHPAFFSHFHSDSGNKLIFNSFGAFSSGKLYSIPEEQLAGDLSKVSPQLLVDGLKWPNEITQIPQSRFGFDAILVPDGFLVPGKSTGSVSIFSFKTNSLIKLTTDKSGWFYHRARWQDCSGDGVPDYLAARANKPTFGSGKGELVCLINPGGSDNLQKVPWAEKVIIDGPDVNFIVEDIDGKPETIEVVAAQFFTKKFVIYQFETASFKHLNTIVIDDNCGQAYDIQLVDLNNDGKKELLANNHESSEDTSAIFCYEIPDDLASGKFTKHTLATGFKVEGMTMGAGSPGFVYAIHPKTDDTSKPYLLVAGDGDKKCWMLTPTQNNFEYTKTLVQDVGGTVGALQFEDWDNDSWNEVVVPDYDGGKLYFYSFSPSKTFLSSA